MSAMVPLGRRILEGVPFVEPGREHCDPDAEDLEGARKLAARAVAAEPEETDSRDTLGQIEARLRDTKGVAEAGERGGK